ncbi:AMP-binding protein [Amycolatopsis sp. NPDC051071]|uniref:non-ribosomal peptide synthetase n=1 Tax=Amycolatopsis sp. NPDC051071 TaxID=3154637 RepID=UPI00341817EF
MAEERDASVDGTPRFRAGEAVASRAQEGLWLLEKLLPNTAAYRVCRRYEVTGPLRVDELGTAWRAVVARHEILRTAIVGGRPVQRITAEPAESFAFAEMSHLSAPDLDSYLAGLVTDSLSFAGGPLARLTVIREAPRRFSVVLVLHRAVADERSVSILIEELSESYTRACGAPELEPAGPEPVAQYADYARWERAQETTPEFGRLLEWWTSSMTPAPASPVLPTDRARSVRPVMSGGRLPFDWGSEVGRGLAEFSRSERTTPFVILLAAFQSLLHRYGGEDRVAVGVPLAARPEEFSGALGPFENLVIHQVDFDGAPSFRELTRRVARVAREASDHRMLGFRHLVRALEADRDPRRIPFCDAMFVLREPETELALSGLEVRPRLLGTGAVSTDLTLTVDQVAPSVAGTLAFRDDLFGTEQASMVLAQLRVLLGAALAAPDVVLDELPLDTAYRRAATARATDRIDDAVVIDEPVQDSVRRHAALAPDRAAVVWGDGVLTYGALEREVTMIADHLQAFDAAGAAVAVRMTPGARQVAASLGALRAGAHLIWLGTGEQGERGRAVLSATPPACLLREWDQEEDDLARWYRDELGGRIVDIGGVIRGRPVRQAREPAPPQETAYIAYTSGSTGAPKGIPQTHMAFAQFVHWLAETCEMGPGARVAQWVAPEHDPSLCEVFATLAAGGTLYPVPQKIRVHPGKLLDWLVTERITFLQTVPSFASELLKEIADQGAGMRLSELKCLVLMGEALPRELANTLRATLPSVRLVNIYGPTETITATWHEISSPVDGVVPIGEPIPGRQVLLLGDDDRPCPTGVTGEIVIRSPYVTRGYVGGGGDGEAFRPVHGLGTDVRCYRTGDLARLRWDGLLEFRGRRDLQVKLQGNRLELAEVEAALAEHDSVAECAVVSLSDERGLVVRLVAYVRARKASPGRADTEVWRGHLRRRFGDAVRLISFEPVSAPLPRTAGGKVDRRRLPKPRARSLATRPPRPGMEQDLAAIWSALSVHPATALEGFFTAGGDSVLIPELGDQVRERFGVDVPVAEFFAHSTLAGMAALIEAAETREDAAA